jgi:hypothetical protein
LSNSNRTAALSCGASAQQDEKLGKLSFPTSCDPKVQAEFERGSGTRRFVSARSSAALGQR